MMCDLTIAAEMPFSVRLARKSALSTAAGARPIWRALSVKESREIWFLCRQYKRREALDMGLVNTVVPIADPKETVRWCREMLQNSPMALRCLKAALNADW